MRNEYFLKIEEDVIAHVYFRTEKRRVTEFVAKLMVLCDNTWHEVIRYDSGHGCPHKDILYINGDVTRKIWYDFLTNDQALTMAIMDIKDNYLFYKERFLKWLNEQ